MRTFEEKVNYNKKHYSTDDFSAGYIIGVGIYRDYPKSDEKGKAETRKMISYFNKIAKGKDRNRKETRLSKGVMCGIRDSANERKRKK